MNDFGCSAAKPSVFFPKCQIKIKIVKRFACFLKVKKLFLKVIFTEKK